MAIVEVCGFNDWLVKLLTEYGCREIVLMQPEKRSKKKTDRRDATRLSELLWVNRERLLAGKRVQGLRRVQPPTARGRDRQVTSVRNGWGGADADDQPHQTRPAQAQPGAGVPDQGVRHDPGPQVAEQLGIGRRWTGWRWTCC